ncbi:competence/damage-inducible protein A [Enterococcus saccharolyticus]|uniref:Putative competence-damage inducible protein n=1 Tax=Candidatus Enterococcus willemsii TaxID=1857215 RepID=A0ABQ6YZN0_9ENTE|nr:MULTISPECIES: competence/damage-inducible protein A [Enterococcus]KAF1304076.1 competence/damage-inducible protein A [Enterococcus sp. CU12B]MCD5002063.1 competence/damage-inducible protein A [Enterococcus saccharolyticus]
MKAEIIAVGTELLLGQVVNTNATFLSEELAGLGIDVYYQSVVGDNPTRLEELLEYADKRSDLIVLCGGLGPTKDDLTKQVTAAHVGQELVQDEVGYQQLMNYFETRQRPMTENNLLQTLVFKDGRALQNTAGLAVGIFYTSAQGKHYLLLPGPPSELKPMFYHQAMPILKKYVQTNEQLISRVMRFYGIGESQLVTDLEDIIAQQTNPTVAPYAKPNEVTLRLTVKTNDEAQGIRQLDLLESRIQERVGAYFYGYGEENTLPQVVVELLREKQKTLTAAESLTGGGFQATLCDTAGVTDVFLGGFVTYSATTKANFLQIDPELLEKYGTVSAECVEAMATQARAMVDTDLAIALSGVAGPKELEGQPVGTTWIALATKDNVISHCYHFPRDRNYIRKSAVMAAFDLIRKELLK